LAANVAVGLRTVTFVDHSRSVHFLNGSVEPRTLVTEVRYPAVGPGGANDVHNAAPSRRAGPYPLVIFGHGFGVTPDVYAPILDAWARAGYIVAAPVFQLGSPFAPGGLNEADLVNWPADMSFVISGMLSESARKTGPLSSLIEGNRIAVSGQSDGGDTALAIAFDPALHDRRVDAAVILSGAEIPELGPFAFRPHGPPLLATQGTADTINLPSATSMFFDAAPRPKFLLTLIGATHLPTYTTDQPYLGVVERVSLAFLDHYLKQSAAALQRMVAAGTVSGAATLTADR
jgi:dienelactone hydrolase